VTARKFKPSETVDFVVVGSGAAGGVMARELSRAGFTVPATPRLGAVERRRSASMGNGTQGAARGLSAFHDVDRTMGFVTSGRGQPTMTIQALAFRAADHIGRFARRNEI
jgi:glycine/D-amino acid oxidase-like deaminating enzyme